MGREGQDHICSDRGCTVSRLQLPANRTSIRYRKDIVHTDMDSVRGIVESSGFFSAEEVEIAVQLVQERLTKGIQSGYHFLFAERGKEVIGYTCFGRIPATKDRYEIYWIAVQNDLRGAGIGRKLLARTEEDISTQGGRRIYIDTSSREKYEPTRSFYRRCGYREEAVLKDFYSPGDAKVIYLKEIKPIVS